MHLHPQAGTPTPSQLLLQPALFNDTIKLLHEAQSYFQQHGVEEHARAPLSLRLILASEMSRITLRLSAVIAWLLARRVSLVSGESPLHAYTLQFRDVCMEESGEAALFLPFPVQSLLERSHALYARVARLDNAVQTLH